MKGALNGINCWYWSMLFLSLAHAVPVSPAANETILQDGKVDASACLYQDERYYEGQNRPSTNPCETCTCQPPDFTCRLKSCDVKVGCKALHSAGHCCPKYICDCQKNGHTYGNGEKVEEPNPCNVCYCRGGEIKCTGLTCYTRKDCEPHYVPGKCCPKYDYCPALEITERQPLLQPTTSAPDQNTTIGEPLPTKQSLLTNEEPNQHVGTMEIIEIYPGNRTKSHVSTTTLEPETSETAETSTFFKNLVTVNDTEGLVISSAYSRVSIDSPKFAEKIKIGTETTTEITTVPYDASDESVTESENVTFSELVEFDVENSTVADSTYSLDDNTTVPTTDYSTLPYEDTTETESITTETTTSEVEEEEDSSSKPETIEGTKQVMGPSLVEMLLKWLQSKRKIGKPEATTVATPQQNATEEARSEKPMSFLTVLQTELLRMANESKPDSETSRSRSLDFENGTSEQHVEISRQEIADLAAALNDTDDPIRLRYPFTDQSLAPVLSMISDQLQFLKVGEEQPIYIEAPPEEDEIEHQHGVVIEPTAPPITVHMVKVVDNQQINEKT